MQRINAKMKTDKQILEESTLVISSIMSAIAFVCVVVIAACAISITMQLKTTNIALGLLLQNEATKSVQQVDPRLPEGHPPIIPNQLREDFKKNYNPDIYEDKKDPPEGEYDI